MPEGEGEEECVGQKLKFNAMFTAGTVSVPLSMMFWGKGDRFERREVGAIGLVVVVYGRVRALANRIRRRLTRTWSLACSSAAGARDFHLAFPVLRTLEAHDVFWNVAQRDEYGVRFEHGDVLLALMHKAGCSVRALFYGLAGLSAVFMMSTNNYVWGKYLDPPEKEEYVEEAEMESGGDGELAKVQSSTALKGWSISAFR